MEEGGGTKATTPIPTLEKPSWGSSARGQRRCLRLLSKKSRTRFVTCKEREIVSGAKGKYALVVSNDAIMVCPQVRKFSSVFFFLLFLCGKSGPSSFALCF